MRDEDLLRSLDTQSLRLIGSPLHLNWHLPRLFALLLRRCAL